MLPSSLRVGFSACVLIALAAGCASSGSSRAPRTESTVSGKDIADSGEPIEKSLQSRFPGVLVTRTSDGGIALQIRGANSVMGSNAPLYVIDEQPVQAGPGGALVGVNPHDIETIQVLKNPPETGIYGRRGATGVIVITTKKPGKRP